MKNFFKKTFLVIPILFQSMYLHASDQDNEREISNGWWSSIQSSMNFSTNYVLESLPYGLSYVSSAAKYLDETSWNASDYLGQSMIYAYDYSVGNLPLKSAEESLDFLQKISVTDRIKNPDFDRIFFQLHFETIRRQLNDANFLGQGGFAKAYKIKLYEKYYVIRVEKPSHGESLENFKDRVQRDRLCFIIQEEFARIYPNEDFVRVLAVSSPQEDSFISIVEYRDGGDYAHHLIKQRQLSYIGQISPDLEKDQELENKHIVHQLQNQLIAYHTGVPFKYEDKDYHLHFVHGDIKPENVVLSTSSEEKKLKASFIDFGLSRIVLNEKEIDKFYEMIVQSHETQLIPLTLKHNQLCGTLLYFSPELIHISNTQTNLEGSKAFLTLINSDIWACNIMTYRSITLTNYFPEFLRRCGTIRKFSNEKSIFSLIAKDADIQGLRIKNHDFSSPAPIMISSR